MVTVEVWYEKGVELKTPKIFSGRLCQYARPFANSSGQEIYFMLRNEGGTSILAPLYSFSRPIYTSDDGYGTRMKFMGDEYDTSGGDGKRIRYKQMWVIDFCGDREEAGKVSAMAEVVAGRVVVEEEPPADEQEVT